MEEWEIVQLKSLEKMNVYSNENTEMKLLNNNADIIALESPDAFGASSTSLKWVNTRDVLEVLKPNKHPLRLNQSQTWTAGFRICIEVKLWPKSFAEMLEKSSSTRWGCGRANNVFESETVKGQPIGWSDSISTIARCFIIILTRLEL